MIIERSSHEVSKTYLQHKYHLDENIAEAIVMGVEMYKSDTSHLATKEELKHEIALLVQKVDSMPDKIFNKVLLAGGSIMAIYKLIEFVAPLMFNHK